MAWLNNYLDDLLAQGQSTFSKAESMAAFDLSSAAFDLAVNRLIKQQRLIHPKRGFYVILRPEDRIAGAPDPIRWIDPLMGYLGIDYRISLLRAAAFHGASHQAAMVFQVIVPKQLRAFEAGRHRIQFIYQSPKAFAPTNQGDRLDRIKSETGYAQVAGIELTLLDAIRYYQACGGVNAAAQLIHDLGAQARLRKLADASKHYEDSSLRRLGYLLELYGHERQAETLIAAALRAKSYKQLNPSEKPISEVLADPLEKNEKWKILVNEFVEIDR